MKSHFLSLLAFPLLAACVNAAPVSTPTATRPAATALASPTPVAIATPLPTLAPTPPTSAPDEQALAMLPAYADDVDDLSLVTRYWIELSIEFNPSAERAQLRGLARVRYTNRGDHPIDDLVFMLWPNHDQYRATMSAGPALIEGELQPPTIEMGGLSQRYALDRPLESGDSLDLSLPFVVETSGPIGFAAPRRFGISQGSLFAPTFYPLVPRNLDGVWEQEVAPMSGDTTNSEVAFYQIRVRFDADYQLVTTGQEIDRQPQANGQEMVTIVSGPARDFALALGAFVSTSQQVGQVQVNGWVLPQHSPDLSRMVRAAADQVELLSRLVGPYPYRELDLVDVPGAFGGIEYPGLVSIGTLGGPNLINPTVHEVGHQWFYGLIGDDQLQQPWLDEAAATYTQVLYLEQASGTGAATGMLSDFREQVRDSTNPELPIGGAVADYASTSDYGLIVYLKGALFFDALRSKLGDETFFAFLQDYLQSYRYQIATAADFQATAESSCSCDLGTLFDLWVYQGGPLPGF